MLVRTLQQELVLLKVESERTMDKRPLEVAPKFVEGVECGTELGSSTVPSKACSVVTTFNLSLGHGLLMLNLIEGRITSTTETSHARVRETCICHWVPHRLIWLSAAHGW